MFFAREKKFKFVKLDRIIVNKTMMILKTIIRINIYSLPVFLIFFCFEEKSNILSDQIIDTLHIREF